MGKLSIDMWGNHSQHEIVSYDCTFYPNGTYYAGNLYNASGDIIGDFIGVDSAEIEKRFPGIFKG